MACFSLFLGVASVAPAAEETPFVTGLSAEERAAIGLNSLTPAQRTALEKAVERYVAGRSEVLVAETATDIRSAMAAEMTEQQQKRLDAEEALAAAQAELAAKQQESDAALATAQAEFARKEQELAAKEQAMITAQDDDTSLLERARVLLTPGTKIEFATVNSTGESRQVNIGPRVRPQGKPYRSSRDPLAVSTSASRASNRPPKWS
mgnify:CR=1 FL=1